jgi:hypothetical protein
MITRPVRYFPATLCDLLSACVFLILRSVSLADFSASEKNAVGSNSTKELFMFSRVSKLSAMLLFIVGVSGCSSGNSSCSQMAASHPGMTCLDVGFGWYHAEFANMPAEQHSGSVSDAPLSTASSTWSSN